ncbi:MAG: TldD/PmbA family protein [Clostridia bacterium]|nr:TldD/PmbA family protein [Clostridia bacterium]
MNKFLKSRMEDAKAVVSELSKTFSYVSVLGTHEKVAKVISSTYSSAINSGETNCGFAIKVYNGEYYSEYACNDIRGLDLEAVKEAVKLSALKQEHVDVKALNEEELTKSFERTDEHPLDNEVILERLTAIREKAQKFDGRVINVTAVHMKREVSEIFVSQKKCLNQYYTWTNFALNVTVRDGDNIKSGRDSSNNTDTAKALEGLENMADAICGNAVDMLKSKPVVPGYYDIITDPSITGLIAHEAFGHGVEMDMFVKHRAKAADYVGKYVASPIVNMRDGAAGVISSGSYFFDDDGVLAHDTEIIRDGILITGISDLLSASQLGTEPTGNGRRQGFDRKSYTRMTNTYFCEGKDKLEDMIASVEHGYLLCKTNNGMEDPKNWQIQCTAEYGLEIKNGKFTGEIVSPVVISGSVLDLLGSISMISDEKEIEGYGMCGKGYKEWVYVSDGGPYLKARAKLG